jgi:hypothetical protein
LGPFHWYWATEKPKIAASFTFYAQRGKREVRVKNLTG